ncbi:unnamed protein product [Polarella glacialis]|uniref:Glycerophosphocholine acyltransferase 1 n=1 Tax=Polarella glacialis TaxID=89957 RepID=A0A813HCG2_POLGL|nr:unnamed protein product [Polarella glacialis]
MQSWSVCMCFSFSLPCLFMAEHWNSTSVVLRVSQLILHVVLLVVVHEQLDENNHKISWYLYSNYLCANAAMPVILWWAEEIRGPSAGVWIFMVAVPSIFCYRLSDSNHCSGRLDLLSRSDNMELPTRDPDHRKQSGNLADFV